ncbi:hypothetical protein [Streptomyces amakusaensis]|uniref:Uncharacterized protein n=1 Tax=Streptomyces amakusaensis TaxID=67271 RepID=A0ABW0AGV8_9ACTN
MVASEVRALFAVASRPEIVSLAGGMPNVSALPMDAVGTLMTELVAERGGRGGDHALAVRGEEPVLDPRIQALDREGG